MVALCLRNREALGQQVVSHRSEGVEVVAHAGGEDPLDAVRVGVGVGVGGWGSGRGRVRVRVKVRVRIRGASP